MQLIERNSYNIRVAVFELKHSHDTLELVLFPMWELSTIIDRFDGYLRNATAYCTRVFRPTRRLLATTDGT